MPGIRESDPTYIMFEMLRIPVNGYLSPTSRQNLSVKLSGVEPDFSLDGELSLSPVRCIITLSSVYHVKSLHRCSDRHCCALKKTQLESLFCYQDKQKS